jgi:hypothetical protein
VPEIVKNLTRFARAGMEFARARVRHFAQKDAKNLQKFVQFDY